MDSVTEDFVSAIEDLTDVVKRLKFPAPVVRVDAAVPTVVHAQALAPTVNVQPAAITMTAAAAPSVTIERPRGSFIVRVTKRDYNGHIEEMVITPTR